MLWLHGGARGAAPAAPLLLPLLLRLRQRLLLLLLLLLRSLLLSWLLHAPRPIQRPAHGGPDATKDVLVRAQVAIPVVQQRAHHDHAQRPAGAQPHAPARGARWYVCMRAYVHVCVRASARTCVRACVFAYVRACMRVYARACVRACMRACVLVLACMHACVLVLVCVRASVHACVRARLPAHLWYARESGWFACMRLPMREALHPAVGSVRLGRLSLHAFVCVCVQARCTEWQPTPCAHLVWDAHLSLMSG